MADDFTLVKMLGSIQLNLDHGSLTGLTDDDHLQYLLADGTRELTGNLAVTALATIDGRDISVDGSKLDGVEASAEVNNISDINATDLTDGGDTTLHDHDGISENTTHRGLVTGNPHVVTKTEVGLSNVPNTDCTDASNISSGTLPSAVLPPVALTSVQVAVSQVAMLALTTEEGDVVVRSDENKSYMKNAGTAGTMADFYELQTPTDSVLSVNGETGTVVLTTGDVGEDTDKNYVTDADITLLGDTSGSNSGDQSTIVGITGTKAEFDTAVTDGNITYDGDAPTAHATSHTDGSDDIQDATAGQKGVATATQITKLDGIEASADVNNISDANAATLTDDSMADALHRHSELSASDGTPNPALSVDASGNVGIGTTSPGHTLQVTDGGATDKGPTLFLNSDYAAGGTHSTFIMAVDNAAYDSASDARWFQVSDGAILNIGVGNGAGSLTSQVTILNDGNVGIGTTDPTVKLDINSDIIRLRTAKTPATAGATGDQGSICWDADYIYVCTATNSWERAALSSW